MFGQFSANPVTLLSETATASAHWERYLAKQDRGLITLHPNTSILTGLSCQSSRGTETRNVTFL